MWRAKLSGDIGSGARWQLALDGGEAGLFSKLVALGSGAAVRGGRGGRGDGAGADGGQVSGGGGAGGGGDSEGGGGAADSGEVWRGAGVEQREGLERAARAIREVALREFDEFARTAGFMEVGEEALGSLLENDGLWTEGGERVYEGWCYG